MNFFQRVNAYRKPPMLFLSRLVPLVICCGGSRCISLTVISFKPSSNLVICETGSGSLCIVVKIKLIINMKLKRTTFIK
ncbi:hypothetical protein HanXRQr2_Chr14g0636541 [Helianthus annuus]|uniref:Uncharacterized protein n=1 Tax=Helianthus annuus TaxID=4232 RepID=A0A9K3H5X0_HELAN|nr:hypothetical protein HanXRQr2_Chr14g0636541 [Helianthus annuus]KAJ0839745.1 hypothetical protein HanPSC8_Chr14g0610481 [Helianthus annuus]